MIVSKVHKGKLCLFDDDRKIGHFQTKEVDAFFVQQWIEILSGKIGEVRGRGQLDWSAGIRERKRLARKHIIDIYSWDSPHLHIIDDNETEDDLDDEEE